MLNYATDIIRVWSEILFSEGLCRVEASHFVCNANRLTGFCMGKGGGWRGGREVGEPLQGSVTEQTKIYFCLLVYICLLQGS